MTAPDFGDLAALLGEMETALDLLHGTAEQVAQYSRHRADLLHWITGKIQGDLKGAIEWHEAAHKAHVGAREIGPRAVS